MDTTKYNNTDEIQTLIKLNDKDSIFLSYRCMSSFKNPLKDLEYHLNSTQNALDVVATTETRIIKNKLPANDTSLTNHSYEYCPTESSD